MTPCIVYPGPLTKTGYARVPLGEVRIDARGRKRGRKMVLLHRHVVERVEGPLGPGEVAMHTCDNRACFRYGSGVAIEPESGWSYLEREAVFSWQPDDDKLTRLAKELRDGWESGYIVETNPL